MPSPPTEVSHTDLVQNFIVGVKILGVLVTALAGFVGVRSRTLKIGTEPGIEQGELDKLLAALRLNRHRFLLVVSVAVVVTLLAQILDIFHDLGEKKEQSKQLTELLLKATNQLSKAEISIANSEQQLQVSSNVLSSVQRELTNSTQALLQTDTILTNMSAQGRRTEIIVTNLAHQAEAAKDQLTLSSAILTNLIHQEQTSRQTLADIQHVINPFGALELSVLFELKSNEPPQLSDLLLVLDDFLTKTVTPQRYQQLSDSPNTSPQERADLEIWPSVFRGHPNPSGQIAFFLNLTQFHDIANLSPSFWTNCLAFDDLFVSRSIEIGIKHFSGETTPDKSFEFDLAHADLLDTIRDVASDTNITAMFTYRRKPSRPHVFYEGMRLSPTSPSWKKRDDISTPRDLASAKLYLRVVEWTSFNHLMLLSYARPTWIGLKVSNQLITSATVEDVSPGVFAFTLPTKEQILSQTTTNPPDSFLQFK